MTDVSRRGFFSTTAGIGLSGLVGRAAAATPAALPGASLRGTVAGDTVTLPPLHAPTDANGKVPNPEPLDHRLRIAVVGLGNLALTEIIPAFAQAKDVKLAGLVSGERAKAKVIAAQYGVPERNIYGYDDYDKLRENGEIDAVYIVLPNALHAEYTVRAAQAGKHVLCEKPMATSVADAQRMVDACRQAKRKLMIAYRMQYTPEHRTLIDFVRNKRFGQVRMIEAVNGQNDLPNGQWRQNKAMAGGGSLPDVGLYCFNAFRYLTGEEPIEVMGALTQPRDDPRFAQIEDISTFTLRFPSGIIATGSAGYSYHEDRRLRVHAAEGWFGCDPAFSYDGLNLQIGRKAGLATALEQRRFSVPSQFAQEMDAFADAIRNGAQPRTPGEEGLQDQRILQAIYEAAAGGSPVKLPPVQGLDTTRGPWPKQLGPFVPA